MAVSNEDALKFKDRHWAEVQKLGREGWELVSVYRRGDWIDYTFKRQAPIEINTGVRARATTRMAMLDWDYTARQRDFTTCFFAAMQLSFRNGSRGEELELSISGPLLPSKADGKADALMVALCHKWTFGCLMTGCCGAKHRDEEEGKSRSGHAQHNCQRCDVRL